MGLGSSPIFVDGIIVLQVDHAAGSYIGGFNAENGEFVWKTTRSETDSWATPVVHQSQVITVGARMLGAYKTRNGGIHGGGYGVGGCDGRQPRNRWGYTLPRIFNLMFDIPTFQRP